MINIKKQHRISLNAIAFRPIHVVRREWEGERPGFQATGKRGRVPPSRQLFTDVVLFKTLVLSRHSCWKYCTLDDPRSNPGITKKNIPRGRITQRNRDPTIITRIHILHQQEGIKAPPETSGIQHVSIGRHHWTEYRSSIYILRTIQIDEPIDPWNGES